MGILPQRPPQNPWAGPGRSGFKGIILDRLDYIKLAFKNYFEEAEQRRAAITGIGNSAKPMVKYETKTKGHADKRARAAGAVEKLK